VSASPQPSDSFSCAPVLNQVSTIKIGHLSGAQNRACLLADSKFAERAGWTVNSWRSNPFCAKTTPCKVERGIDLISRLKAGHGLRIQAAIEGGPTINFLVPLSDFKAAYESPPSNAAHFE
jgi:hypothetical protein